MEFLKTPVQNKIKLQAILSKEEYAELKLALFDATLDAASGELTPQGKTAIWQLSNMFRKVFVEEVNEAVEEEHLGLP